MAQLSTDAPVTSSRARVLVPSTANEALGRLEDLLSRFFPVGLGFPEVIRDRIMKPQHRKVKLCDDDVFVVPAVSNDGVVVGVTRKIKPNGFLARDVL